MTENQDQPFKELQNQLMDQARADRHSLMVASGAGLIAVLHFLAGAQHGRWIALISMFSFALSLTAAIAGKLTQIRFQNKLAEFHLYISAEQSFGDEGLRVIRTDARSFDELYLKVSEEFATEAKRVGRWGPVFERVSIFGLLAGIWLGIAGLVTMV